MRKSINLSLAFLFLSLIPPQCLAQCVVRTISVSRVQGTTFDPSGQPIPNVQVSLEQDGRLVASFTTDESGGFSVPANPGDYELHANARGFASGVARINVGSDLIRVVRPTHIWMILYVGSAELDRCPGFATTSRAKFEKSIRKKQRD
jgi:hypothetical protein